MVTTSDRVAVADLSTPYPLDIIFVFAISDDYPLDDNTTASFELTDQRGNTVLATAIGGYISRVGQELTLLIPADATDYPISGGVTYQYGFTLDDFSRVQGNLFSLARTGAVVPEKTTLSLSLSACTVSVSLIGVGVASGYEAYRTITEDGAISASDQTVEIVAGGEDITVALPLSADLFDSENSKTLLVDLSRDPDDTGVVTVTGDGSELLSGIFFPGDQVIIKSNGTKLLING